MKKISILDTSISTRNVGDEIIMDSVNNFFKEKFSDSQISRIPTHQKLSLPSLRIAKSSDFCVIGGTNLLNGNMPFYKQWKVDYLTSFLLKNKVVLMGVGWWQYQNYINIYSKAIYKNILSKEVLHSVRDSYTLKKLNDIGIYNVVNTGCPTLWKLDQEHCKMIPRKKKDIVIFTLTDYNRNPELDKKIIKNLRASYAKIAIWIQGMKDLEYLKELAIENIFDEIVPPNLVAYDRFLMENSCDYVGTRLHAGVRALQYKRRALIIAVDNRAEEMRKDFNIPVIKRSDEEISLEPWNSEFSISINLDYQAIKKWSDSLLLN